MAFLSSKHANLMDLMGIQSLEQRLIEYLVENWTQKQEATLVLILKRLIFENI